MKQRKRRLPADKVREVVTGNWYQRVPIPPESTWPKCSSCSTPARILDADHGECLRCRIVRKKEARLAGRAGEMGT